MSQLLQEYVEKQMVRNFILNESVKIKKTKVYDSGYWLILTSDLPGSEGTSETKAMSVALGVRKDDNWDKPFTKPTYFNDRVTGIFGWGYFVAKSATPEKIESIIKNLKSLVVEFNEKKKLPPDEEVRDLTLNQIKSIEQIVQAVQNTEVKAENEEVKRNLQKYLEDLEAAVESDEVFEFLILNLEKAKTFQKRNTGWNYSILNSLIITISDPTATYAGPQMYWDGRNYQVKKEFLTKGINILKPATGKGTDVNDKVKFFKDNPEELTKFKKEMGISPEENFDFNSNKYQLAKYATEKSLVKKDYKNRFKEVMVYTDNMVEAVPGKETHDVVEPEIPETGTTSKSGNEISFLFSSVLKTVASKGINIPSTLKSDDTDVHNLGRIIFAIALSDVGKQLMYKGKENTNQQDLIKMQAETIAYIVKKHFGLPAEKTKYNLANLGIDKSKLQMFSNNIINTADKIINDVEKNLNSPVSEGIRKMIRNILFENFIKKN
jgi:hypothetical protein